MFNFMIAWEAFMAGNSNETNVRNIEMEKYSK